MISLNIYNQNLERIGAIETWVSLAWEEEYGAEGKFQLEVWQTKTTAALLKEDVYCGMTGSETLAIIKSVQISGQKIVCNGFMSVYVLESRASTRKVSAENAETAMRALVSGASAWPCVALGESAGLADVFGPEIRDMSVLEYAKTISEETDVGFRMRHNKNAKQLLFECYKPGINENARFATAYGNLGEIEYTVSSIDYANVAVVVNTYSTTKDDVTTENRTVVYAGATETSGADRREIVVKTTIRPEDDETDEAFQARILAEGEAELIECARIENIKFEVNDERVKLGDVITALLPEIGMTVTARVVGVTITSQKNKNIREISVGTPIRIRRR